MNIVCAKCGAGVTFERASLVDQTVIVCSACCSGLKVTIQAFDVPATAAPPGSAAASATRASAMVAVQGEATRELIRELLSSAGYDVLEVTSGAEALAKVRDARPAVVLVDVGLSDMPGFQVCETIRADSANRAVKMILVAAIHNKDRYRRPPDNLFGADDYVERHQIESQLIEKVRQLIGEASTGGPARVSEPSQASSEARFAAPAPTLPPKLETVTPRRAEPIALPDVPSPPREAVLPGPTPVPAMAKPVPAAPAPATRPPVAPPAPEPVAAGAPAPAASNPAQEAALRLARIIVSDIALYNAKKVDEGVLNGTFFDLLRTEIEEGRKLYEERKGPGLTTTVDLFKQTIEQFVATRRELLRRNRPAAA